MQDEKFLQDIIDIRNISLSTQEIYRIVITKYTKQNNKSMKELIKEAEKEEEERVRWKNRTIRTRLLKFRAALYKDYLKNTAKRYFTCICTIYRHCEIEIGDLPPISEKNVKTPRTINYRDLPDEEIIKKALDIAKIRDRAIILFIISSGCGRTEVSNLTVQDYIDATYSYHHSSNIYEVLSILKDREDIVPQFEILRKKTNKHYTTFCSPEAANAINVHLVSKEKEIHNTDRLFDIGASNMNYVFNVLNEKLNLGKKGTYTRLRPHMLRKFHASRLHNAGMSVDNVDSLQGRSKSNVHKAYFLDDPASLKEEYMRYMDAVMIGWNLKNLTYKSKEYIELERENLRKSKDLDVLSSRLESIEHYIFKNVSKSDVEDMEGWL